MYSYMVKNGAPNTPQAGVKKKATFNLNSALHQRLKIAAAVSGREMGDIVEEALETHLAQLEKRLRKNA
jgi:predicted DNA-binding protein